MSHVPGHDDAFDDEEEEEEGTGSGGGSVGDDGTGPFDDEPPPSPQPPDPYSAEQAYDALLRSRRMRQFDSDDYGTAGAFKTPSMENGIARFLGNYVIPGQGGDLPPEAADMFSGLTSEDLSYMNAADIEGLRSLMQSHTEATADDYWGAPEALLRGNLGHDDLVPYTTAKDKLLSNRRLGMGMGYGSAFKNAARQPWWLNMIQGQGG